MKDSQIGMVALIIDEDDSTFFVYGHISTQAQIRVNPWMWEWPRKKDIREMTVTKLIKLWAHYYPLRGGGNYQIQKRHRKGYFPVTQVEFIDSFWYDQTADQLIGVAEAHGWGGNFEYNYKELENYIPLLQIGNLPVDRKKLLKLAIKIARDNGKSWLVCPECGLRIKIMDNGIINPGCPHCNSFLNQKFLNPEGK
jgi:hypothetical protein